MSRRHRHFNVLPARLANISCGGNTPAASRDGHDFGHDFTAGGSQLADVNHLRRASFRIRRRQWITAAGAVSPCTPMWTSRTAWLCGVSAWAACSAGAAILSRVHLTPAMLARVTSALARFADGSSGRHCAVTNARVAQAAGCSPRTVSTVRAVLAEAHFAIEARRGTGSSTTPAHLRRPSIWHLTSRRLPVDNAPFCDLPRSRRVTGSSAVDLWSPSEASDASPRKISPKRASRRRPQRQARPLHTQRLAGWLASSAIGLSPRSGQHVVGQLSDALDASHLDLQAWTGPALVDALNQDMRQRRLTWPDRIARPGPFLAHRLRYLPTRPVTPPVRVASAASTQQPARPAVGGPPSEARRDALEAIRAILCRRSR